MQAGILDPPDGSSDLARQILSDPHLSEEQKQALVRIYLSFRREFEGDIEAGEQGPTGPPDGVEASSEPAPAVSGGSVHPHR